MKHYATYADYQPESGSPTPDLAVDYLYDAFNRWIGQTITTASGGVSTVQHTAFAYDGNQIVMQFDGTGTSPLTSTSLSHRYLWGPVVDQLISDEQLVISDIGGYDQSTPGNVVWALTDNVNTVRDLATFDPTADGGEGATTLANHRLFSAYGQMLKQTNPTTLDPASVDCIFGFTGRAMSRFSKDAATGAVTGIQNNLNRWYDAALMRWLSQDPKGLGPDLNPYRYCGDNPTNYVDPSGLNRYVSGTAWNEHAGIAVDTWEERNGVWVKTGAMTFDFSADYGSSFYWLGAVVFNGKVTDSKGNGLTNPQTIPSTWWEDQKLLKVLEQSVEFPRHYSVPMYNCRDYAFGHKDVGIGDKKPPPAPPRKPPPKSLNLFIW